MVALFHILKFIFRNTLKIAHPSQLKFTAESDLLEIGMSKPEMRRLRKYYDKHFPHNYLSKLKKIINYRKQGQSSNDPYLLMSMDALSVSRAPRVSSKHIIPAASITINKELGMGEFGVVQQGVWCNEGERIQVSLSAAANIIIQNGVSQSNNRITASNAMLVFYANSSFKLIFTVFSFN